MSDDIYVETLSWFKQIEKPEVVLLIADNHDLVRIVVACVNVHVIPQGVTTQFPPWGALRG